MLFIHQFEINYWGLTGLYVQLLALWL